ncbi:tyrosine-type recombinase/integrase [Vagococcus silagei]|uniref:Integrase n=1 Tax=Vagococcus silagei TaxID=2508885 RepID=A0A4S3B2W8_9ENTE|nr:tyrosine-type recombinase/integrase [Vagococcus silagei]THB60577.1 integrase [Vagococcus silagei]
MIQSFLEHLAKEGKAISTIDEYKRRLDKFERYLKVQKLEAIKLQTRDMVTFRDYLLSENLSNRRVNQILSTVHCYYNFLIVNGKLPYNPVVQTLQMTPKVQRIERLSDDDLKCFRDYIDQFQPNVRCAFLLMMATGARVGEITHLKKSDFFIKDNYLFISITEAKWQSDRQIPILDQEIAGIIQIYLEDLDITSLPAFRMSKRTLQRHMTNFANDTGIKCCCHLIRHTFATKLLESGVPLEVIKAFLGHKSINMTAYYTQSARVDLTEITIPNWQIDLTKK